MPTIDFSGRHMHTRKAADLDPRFISAMPPPAPPLPRTGDTNTDTNRSGNGSNHRSLFRAAAMEYLFSRLSPALLGMEELGGRAFHRLHPTPPPCNSHPSMCCCAFVLLCCALLCPPPADAEAAAGVVFREAEAGRIPRDLVTVHIRW